MGCGYPAPAHPGLLIRCVFGGKGSSEVSEVLNVSTLCTAFIWTEGREMGGVKEERTGGQELYDLPGWLIRSGHCRYSFALP